MFSAPDVPKGVLFKPISEPKLNETDPFEEEELENIMNNISLIGNVSRTESRELTVDEEEEAPCNPLDLSISAAFSYNR